MNTPDTLQALQIVQLCVGLLTLGGSAFAVGVLFNKVETLGKNQTEIKDALFGGDGQQGAFLRRSEANLMIEASQQDRAALRAGLEEVRREVFRIESRLERANQGG